MEIQIKKAVRAGNSSAVILPRAWLNKEVRIELVRKTPEKILAETIDILNRYIQLKEVIGIYLVGSYAREEEEKNSDIDILVTTQNTDKEIIHEGIYSLLIISAGLLKQKLKQDLFPVGQMIREAKPLLNSNYLGSMRIKVTKKNVKWYLDTTKHKLEIIRKIIDKMKGDNKRYASDKVAYTLILRIRTLQITQKLIENKDYSKKEFIKMIKDISKGKNAYERYLAVKNNSEEENRSSLEEIERLYEYLKNQLAKINKLIENIDK